MKDEDGKTNGKHGSGGDRGVQACRRSCWKGGLPRAVRWAGQGTWHMSRGPRPAQRSSWWKPGHAEGRGCGGGEVWWQAELRVCWQTGSRVSRRTCARAVWSRRTRAWWDHTMCKAAFVKGKEEALPQEGAATKDEDGWQRNATGCPGCRGCSPSTVTSL